jgi:hypothetical protein
MTEGQAADATASFELKLQLGDGPPVGSLHGSTHMLNSGTSGFSCLLVLSGSPPEQGPVLLLPAAVAGASRPDQFPRRLLRAEAPGSEHEPPGGVGTPATVCFRRQDDFWTLEREGAS